MAKKPVKKQEEKLETKKPETKKPEVKKVEVKKVEDQDGIPKSVLNELKNIAKRYFKEEKFSDVKDAYSEVYDEYEEKYSKILSSAGIHKKALATFKNKKKRDLVGGAVEKYQGVIFGCSRVRDINSRRRAEIFQIYDEDIERAISEGLVMTTSEVNPETGEEEYEPILDSEQRIIPRDNREFFKRNDGTTFKNPQFGRPIPSALRKTLIGVLQTSQGNEGIFIMELRDEFAEKEYPMNKFVEFTAKTLETNAIQTDSYEFCDKSTIQDFIDTIKDDIKIGDVNKDFFDRIIEYYEKILNDNEQINTIYKLRNSRRTSFKVCKNEEIDLLDMPKIYYEPDVNTMYKKYMYPFTSDCSHLIEYHEKNRYINGDKEKINWDEFIVLQDLNILQINMETSLSGNYTLYGEDDSLYRNEIEHLGNEIDSIRLLVPSHVNIDFAQESKVNIIGSIIQFQSKDEDGVLLTEKSEDSEGNEIDVPILDYPLIMVYGMYAIPEYKISVETIDLTHDDEIDVDDLISTSIDDDIESDMKEAVEKVNNKPKPQKTKEKQPSKSASSTKKPTQRKITQTKIPEKTKKQKEDPEGGLDEELDEEEFEEELNIDELEYIDDEDISEEDIDEEPW